MLSQFQSGMSPVGHFDFLDSEIDSILGGEVVVLDTVPSLVVDQSSPDVWEDGVTRVVARKANRSDRGPFYLVDSDRSKLGGSEIGIETTSLFSVASATIASPNVSGKLSIWAQEGFYSLSTDVIASDIDTSTPIYTPLYVSDGGLLTSVASKTVQIAGYFVEYRDKSVIEAELGRFQYAGMPKSQDAVIIYKTNADGYLNLDYMSELVGSFGTIGTPTDGTYADGYHEFAATTTISDAVDALNESFEQITRGSFPIVLGAASDGTYSDGYYAFMSTTSTSDAIDQLNEGLGQISTGEFPIPIGTPSDGTYSDGYFAFTPDTQMPDAIDQLNEQTNTLVNQVTALNAYVTISTGTLYVNHDTGSNSNDGTSLAPLATIQEAVNRFLPLAAGIQNWDYGDDRTIMVQDPGNANSNFEESIVIPPHAGLGILYIIGEETTLAGTTTLTSGSVFQAISGYEVRHNLYFQLPVSPAFDDVPAWDDAGFWVPGSFTNTDPFARQLEYLPHVELQAGPSGGNIASVVALDPNSWTAFEFPNSTSVSLVAPVTTWQPGPADATNGFLAAPCITNQGSPLIVQGFNFTAREDTDQFLQGSVLHNTGGPTAYQTSDTVGTVWISRCILDESPVNGTGFYELFSGFGISVSAIIKAYTAGFITRNAEVTFVNTRMDGVDDFKQSTLSLWGIDISGVGGWSFDDCTIENMYVDLRGNLVLTRTDVTINALTVESAGVSPAVRVERKSELRLNSVGSRLAGTTGNTGVGMIVQEMSQVVWSGSIVSATLSGSSGDLQVGGNAARAWTAGDETETTTLARFGST